MTDVIAWACLNGELMPADAARVPIWDRGFLFGDAVYEVFRLTRGRLWLEDLHFARLERSLGEMLFEPIDLERLRGRIEATIGAGGVVEGTVYVQLTRGVAPRLHAFPRPPVEPTEVIVVRPYDDGPTRLRRERGVGVISLPDERWGRCDVKSTNLLANVIANERAQRAGCYEAVLFDRDGFVTEATHSSVIWVRGGRLEATAEGRLILPGTTRRFVERLADDAGVDFAAARITLEDLRGVDELMLLGTTIEVMPVTTLDGAPVGSATPGPVATRLQRAHDVAVERWAAGTAAGV